MAVKNIRFCTVDPSNKRKATLNGDAFKGTNPLPNVYVTGYATATNFQGGMVQGSTTDWITYKFNFGGVAGNFPGTSTGTMGLGWNFTPTLMPIGTQKVATVTYNGVNDSRFPPDNLDYWVKESPLVLQYWAPTPVENIKVDGDTAHIVTRGSLIHHVLTWDESTIDQLFFDEIVGYNVYRVKRGWPLPSPAVINKDKAEKMNAEVIPYGTTMLLFDQPADEIQYNYFFIETLSRSTTDILNDVEVMSIQSGLLAVPNMTSTFTLNGDMFYNEKQETNIIGTIQVKDALASHKVSIDILLENGTTITSVKSLTISSGQTSFTLKFEEGWLMDKYKTINGIVTAKVKLSTISSEGLLIGIYSDIIQIDAGYKDKITRYGTYESIALAIRNVNGTTATYYPSLMAPAIRQILDMNTYANYSFAEYSCIQDFLDFYNDSEHVACFYDGGFLKMDSSNMIDMRSFSTNMYDYVYDPRMSDTVIAPTGSVTCLVTGINRTAYAQFYQNISYLYFVNQTKIQGGDSTVWRGSSMILFSAPKATSMLNYVFRGAVNVEKVDMPLMLKTGSATFSLCRNLKFVNLLSAETIERSTFNKCSALQNVQLPNVKVLSTSCFNQCISLEDVLFPNATVVHSWAFHDCTNLKTAVFGPNMSSITHNTFNGCTSLLMVAFMYEGVVPWGEDVFKGIDPAQFIIRVPAAYLETYKTTAKWSSYANNFVAI